MIATTAVFFNVLLLQLRGQHCWPAAESRERRAAGSGRHTNIKRSSTTYAGPAEKADADATTAARRAARRTAIAVLMLI